MSTHRSAPVFQRIKDYLVHGIQAGTWKAGDAIPSESALSAQFHVSRMTVNRAVRELSAEQVLVRVQGSGTFVARHKYQATLVEIKSIAEEIHARGHRHSSRLHLLECEPASQPRAATFGLRAGAPLFHSVIVHFENDLAIQVEDRWVNPALAPAYLEQDFSRTTPNAYLMAVAPLEGVDYRIEAVMPPKHIAAMLDMPLREACLVLERVTRSQGAVATHATMWHPGLRYQFAGSF